MDFNWIIAGDSRMKVAESPQKTKNIVVPLMAEFENVYVPLLDNLDPIVEVSVNLVFLGGFWRCIVSYRDFRVNYLCRRMKKTMSGFRMLLHKHDSSI
jgi:hypothetical protein